MELRGTRTVHASPHLITRRIPLLQLPRKIHGNFDAQCDPPFSDQVFNLLRGLRKEDVAPLACGFWRGARTGMDVAAGIDFSQRRGLTPEQLLALPQPAWTVSQDGRGTFARLNRECRATFAIASHSGTASRNTRSRIRSRKPHELTTST
jgi:hypothetical protein